MLVYLLPTVFGCLGARFVPTQYLPGYLVIVLGALLAVAATDLMLARGHARCGA